MGDFLLHPIRWAPFLDHQRSFRRAIPVPTVILCGCDWVIRASRRWPWTSSMRDLTWCGCVLESRVWGLLPHLSHALAVFLELVIVLEHVACFLLAILFVDVEVYGAWTRQFF